MLLFRTRCHRHDDEVIVDLRLVGNIQLGLHALLQFPDHARRKFERMLVRVRWGFVGIILPRRAGHLDVRAQRRADRMRPGKSGEAINAGAVVAHEIDRNVKPAGIKRIAR